MGVVGLRIEYQVGNQFGETVLRDLAVAFETAGDNLSDFGKYVFPRLTPVFEKHLSKQFASEGGAGEHGRWAPLSDAYARWKNRHHPGLPILELTGALSRALTDSSDSGAYREYTAAEYAFGTRGVAYASFHQLGTESMPARPEFDFPSEFRDDLQAAALEGVREAIRASRLGQMGIEVEGGA